MGGAASSCREMDDEVARLRALPLRDGAASNNSNLMVILPANPEA
jgi:hypothetical protein